MRFKALLSPDITSMFSIIHFSLLAKLIKSRMDYQGISQSLSEDIILLRVNIRLDANTQRL